MLWIDIGLIVIILGLVIHGIIIGLIRGIFDIAGIILGYLLAINYSDALRIPEFLAFFLIFIIVAVIVSILGRVISKLIHITPLGLLDRIFGGLFGFLKGFIVCFVFLIILLLLHGENRTIYRSEIVHWVIKGGLTMSQVLPKKWYDWIEDVTTERELVKHNEGYYVHL